MAIAVNAAAAMVVPFAFLEPLVWVYSPNTPVSGAPPNETHRYRALQTRQWTATCEKIRRVRR